MAEELKDAKAQLDLLRSIPLDGPTDEKVETIWRQLMINRSVSSDDLAEAKARRAEAEVAREQAEKDAINTAQAVAGGLKAEAERELTEAKRIAEEARHTRQGIEAELDRLKVKKADAEKERDQVIAEAQKSAQEIIDQARAAAQRETTELRGQALKEIKTVLTRVESMRASVNEELEIQRILTNVAKLRANSRAVISEFPEAATYEEEPEPESSPAAEPPTNEESESEGAAPQVASVRPARRRRSASKA